MEKYLLANGFTQTYHKERFFKDNLVVFTKMKYVYPNKKIKMWVIAIDGKELYTGNLLNIKLVLKNQFKFNN